MATIPARLPSGAGHGLHQSAGKRWPPSGRRRWQHARRVHPAGAPGKACRPASISGRARPSGAGHAAPGVATIRRRAHAVACIRCKACRTLAAHLPPPCIRWQAVASLPAASIRQGSGQGMASIRQGMATIRAQAVAACPPRASGTRAGQGVPPGIHRRARPAIRRTPWTLCRPRVHQRAEHPGKACRHQAAGHGLHHACPLPSAERRRWPACPPGRHPAGHQARHGHHQGAGGGSMPAACIRQARRARRAARHPSAGAPSHQAQAMQRRAWPPSGAGKASMRACIHQRASGGHHQGASRGHHQAQAVATISGAQAVACITPAASMQRPCNGLAAGMRRKAWPPCPPGFHQVQTVASMRACIHQRASGGHHPGAGRGQHAAHLPPRASAGRHPGRAHRPAVNHHHYPARVRYSGRVWRRRGAGKHCPAVLRL